MNYYLKPKRRWIKGFSSNGLVEGLIITLTIALGVAIFFYLADRALRINTDGYCANYPKALSCQPIAKK